MLMRYRALENGCYADHSSKFKLNPAFNPILIVDYIPKSLNAVKIYCQFCILYRFEQTFLIQSTKYYKFVFNGLELSCLPLPLLAQIPKFPFFLPTFLNFGRFEILVNAVCCITKSYQVILLVSVQKPDNPSTTFIQDLKKIRPKLQP